MTTMRLSGEQVTQLVELLTVTADTAASDEDRYQLHYSRSQVHQLMPGIEALVLAGVLADMTDRPDRTWPSGTPAVGGARSWPASSASPPPRPSPPSASSHRRPPTVGARCCGWRPDHPTSRLVEGKLYEYEVLRLARAGGTSVRFAIASEGAWCTATPP